MKRLYLLFALLLFAAQIVARNVARLDALRSAWARLCRSNRPQGTCACPSGESPHGSRRTACACGKAPDR